MRDERGRFLRGEKSFNYGKHHSEETKKKISESHKGKKLSEEHRRKISEALKGRIITGEWKRKISEVTKGKNNPFYGKNHSEEAKRKLSKFHENKKLPEETKLKMSEAQKGEKSHNWKGGLTPINKRIRHSLEYKFWRRAVFERDDYTCKVCGKRGCRLNAHHVKSFAKFPELRFEIDNGITRCVDCHRNNN